MELQKLRFPDPETCMLDELFFRINDSKMCSCVMDEERKILLAQGSSLHMDTLFNSFSIEKWVKYTRLSNLKIRFEFQGEAQLALMRRYMIGDEMFLDKIKTKYVHCIEKSAVEMDIPYDDDQKGIVFLQLDCLGERNIFYGGAYVTDMEEDELNPIDIAIDICTFKREKYVVNNIGLLKRRIIEDDVSPVCGHLDIFVSDNGKTLDTGALNGEHVHIFPNKNAGGAGGFSRGMMEILDAQKGRKRPFTHVLVMDDDVVINPDAIERTSQLLRFMKPEYHGKTIAGAMMRLDKRSVQHECGGYWDGDEVKSAHFWLDMIDVKNIVRNEQLANINFNAWWYSCIPIEKISDENLPLPIFIRFDDVEYGLRTGSDILSLNGICLWHEPFEYKYSASMDYYHMRNSLIIDAFHCPKFDGKKAVRHMRYVVLHNLMRYRYANVELIFRGVEDFCAGPKALFSKDVEALHKEIMAASDKFLPLDQLDIDFNEETYKKSFDWKENPLHRKFRLMTGNGLLLPARGDNVVNAVINSPLNFYRKKRVLNYDVLGHRGFVSHKSVKKTVAALRKMLALSRRLERDHARLCEEYRAARGEITSRAFWNKYLGIRK